MPHLSLSPLYWEGLLRVTLGLSPAAIKSRRASRRSSHQNSAGSKGSAGSKRFHSTIGGSSCRASPRYSVRHASRSSTRFTHRYM